MVREFSRERSNEWEGILRRDPKRWMAELWVEVYNFPKEGRRWVSRTDKFTSGKFSTPINPKDGYVVADCEDPRERRVLEFVVPIMYLEKPTHIIVTISNTIFGGLSSVKLVSWGVVIQEVVGKSVFRLEKEKPSPINLYFFRLYNGFECLGEEETTLLFAAKMMLQFDIAPKPKAQPEMKDEDSERELLESEEIRKLTKVSPNLGKKSTYRAIDGKTPIWVPNWREVVLSSLDFQDDPFQRIQEEID